MVQKDYILRMIEMMALMVRRVREMIAAGQFGAVESELASAAARTGIDLAIGRQLEGEALVGLFMPDGANVDPTNALLYGEVLFLDGLRCRATGDVPGGGEMLAKALLLFEAAMDYATAIGVRYPETDARIAEIHALLDTDTEAGAHR